MIRNYWIITAAAATCIFVLSGKGVNAMELGTACENSSISDNVTVMNDYGNKMETDIEEPESDTEETESDTEETESDAKEPESDSKEPESDAEEIEPDAEEIEQKVEEMKLNEAEMETEVEEIEFYTNDMETKVDELNIFYSDKTVYDFVLHMYDKVLGRRPEENGLKYWYENIVNDKKTGADVAADFFNSPEYKGRGCIDDTFIEHLYETMLNRDSDVKGKQYWMHILEMGVSRDYLLNRFVESDEYNRRCQERGIEVGTYVLTQPRDLNLNITKYITHFYRTVLGRNGEEAGLNEWTGGLLSQRYNGAAILKSFFFSNEYLKKNKSDDLYIDDLYSAAFSRQADSVGKTYWLKVFDDNLSRHYPAAGFNDSGEYKNLLNGYGVDEGEYLWLEARDQNRTVTAYMNRMIVEGTGRKSDSKSLNQDLCELYQGKMSALDLVVKYMQAEEFSSLDEKNYVKKASQLILGREATDREMSEGVSVIQYEGRSAMVRQLASCSEFSHFCKKNDIEMLNTAENRAMCYAKEQLDLLEWDIRSAYDWIVNNFNYVQLPSYNDSNHTQYYGCYGFENKKGNCYVMAAVFYWMAKAKGIDVDYIEGVVPGARVARAPHGWCEATINGERYIFDPDFQYETGKNGYKFIYKTPGTWKYMDGVIMN